MARKSSKSRNSQDKAAAAHRGAPAIARPIDEDAIETEAHLVGDEADESLGTGESDDGAAADDDFADKSDTVGAAHRDFETDDSGDRIPVTGIAGEADEDGADSGSLVPFDPLSRYLAELRRFPLLTREEEIKIAKRYAKFHDPADAFKLVTANLRLVVKIANEFARATRNLLDLVQEGNVGLMEAVKHFNPDVGIRFPSYAVWWVRAYIYRFLINNSRLVKVGTTQAQRKLFFNLRKETERLEAEGFTPQPKLLAQRMGVKESEVREMQERMAHSEVSLDHPTGPGEETTLMESLPDSSFNPEEAAARAQWRNFAHEKVEEFASTLGGKELEIFRSRLLSEEPPTLQEVGGKFGISRERVRQIESRLKRRLKAFLKAQAGDVEQAET